jgi:hypothetical protein
MTNMTRKYPGMDHNFRQPYDISPDKKVGISSGNIPDPGLAGLIPVVGPLWEAGYDLEQGDYGGAAFNAGAAAFDMFPVSSAVKLYRIMKIMRRYKKGLASAKTMQQRYKARGLVSPGQEVHHTVALKGASRTAKGDFRNHPALLKVLERETHQRLTRSWNGKPKFDPVRKIWYGSTDLQKALPVMAVGRTADTWEYLDRNSLPRTNGR